MAIIKKILTSKGRGIVHLLNHGASLRNQRGFTLIEIIVVIGIITILATILILYGRGSEGQLILFKEQSKLVSALYRAKALSVQTYSDQNPPCGYGIHFDPPGSYIMFRDIPPAGGCINSDNKYLANGSTPDEIVYSYTLSPSVVFSALLVTDVVFIPPNPKTVFQYVRPGDTTDPVSLTLQTSNGSTLSLAVNSAGQITLP